MEMPSITTAQNLNEVAPLLSLSSLSAFLTLTLMEIVLGIDNIVFVAIQVSKLPAEQQNFGRKVGMSLALILRLVLLMGISWVIGLTQPIITLPSFLQEILKINDFSWRDLILIAGGLFLLYKGTTEIFEKLEGAHEDDHAVPKKSNLRRVIAELIVLDLVFSLDSVITAVGMASRIDIMVVAMFIAVGVMMIAARSVGDFVHKHPSVKILALSFLNLIGVMLLLEGMHQHVNKGYIYSAMAFSLLVEIINMRYRKKRKAVELSGLGTR